MKITILAPSIDLRNRYGLYIYLRKLYKRRKASIGDGLVDLGDLYDLYKVDVNNGSIVILLEYKNSKIILGGDAQFDSWAKVVEEFPKKGSLNSQGLKVAHHGSKHGTSLE